MIDRELVMRRARVPKSVRALLVVLAFLAATGGAAWARTGYDANARSVVFYFGETAGAGDSRDFAGYGSVKLCTDGDNSGGGGTYNAQYRHNRGGLPDETVVELYQSYKEPARSSGNFTNSSSANYHTNASWAQVTAAADNVSGFSASRTSSLSCP